MMKTDGSPKVERLRGVLPQINVEEREDTGLRKRASLESFPLKDWSQDFI